MKQVVLEAGGLLRGSSGPALESFLLRHPGIDRAEASFLVARGGEDAWPTSRIVGPHGGPAGYGRPEIQDRYSSPRGSSVFALDGRLRTSPTLPGVAGATGFGIHVAPFAPVAQYLLQTDQGQHEHAEQERLAPRREAERRRAE